MEQKGDYSPFRPLLNGVFHRIGVYRISLRGASYKSALLFLPVVATVSPHSVLYKVGYNRGLLTCKRGGFGDINRPFRRAFYLGEKGYRFPEKL